MLLVPETFWKRGLVFLVSNQRGPWAARFTVSSSGNPRSMRPARNPLGSHLDDSDGNVIVLAVRPWMAGGSA